jgi:hypothetical protein
MDKVNRLRETHIYGTGKFAGRYPVTRLISATELTDRAIWVLSPQGFRLAGSGLTLDESQFAKYEKGPVDKRKLREVNRNPEVHLRQGLSDLKEMLRHDASMSLADIVRSTKASDLASTIVSASFNKKAVYAFSEQWALQYVVFLVQGWTMHRIYDNHILESLKTKLNRPDSDMITRHFKNTLTSSQLCTGWDPAVLSEILTGLIEIIQSKATLRTDSELLVEINERVAKLSTGAQKSINLLVETESGLKGKLQEKGIELCPFTTKVATFVNAPVDKCAHFKYIAINKSTGKGVLIAGGKTDFSGSNAGYLASLMAFAIFEFDRTTKKCVMKSIKGINIAGIVCLPAEVNEPGTEQLRRLGIPVVYPLPENLSELSEIISEMSKL